MQHKIPDDINIIAQTVKRFLISTNTTEYSFAEKIGVDQSRISRIATGQIKRINNTVKRAYIYAIMRLVPVEENAAINENIKRYISEGCDVELLSEIIEKLIESKQQFKSLAQKKKIT